MGVVLLLALVLLGGAGLPALAQEDATSAIVFTIGPLTVAPGGTLTWSATATCTGPPSGSQSCSAGGTTVGGPVPNGYSMDVQQDTSITFPAPTTRDTKTTSGGTGTAGGSFSAPTTSGTYYYRARHPEQKIGSVTWATATSNVVIVEVQVRSTMTSVSCSPDPIPVDAPSTCTATVTDTAAGTPITPTGTVTWTSNAPGSFSAGACTLSGSGGSASCSVSYTPSAIGSQTVTATYDGDSSHSSSSGSDTVTVIKRSTTTTVACSPASVPVGASASCTATVKDSETSGTKSAPTGSAAFSATPEGSFAPTSCPLVPTATPGEASCMVTFTPGATGPHTVSASYGGDPKHAASSGTTTVTAIKRTTSTSVSCMPSTVPVDASTHCTATVSDTDSGSKSTPTGTVSFTSSGSGSFSGGSCTLGEVVLGEASCSVDFSPGAAGTQTITASYSGDGNHDGSSGTASVMANKRSTSTSVDCTPSPVPVDAPTTCTATVKDTDIGTKSAPGATVNFLLDTATTPFASCTLTATSTPGVASCSVTFSPGEVGVHTITASYAGDAKHSTSSGTTTLTVTKRSTTTAVSCVPATIAVDSSTTCTATVTDAEASGTKSAPTGSVTFASSGSGSFSGGGSCTLSPTGTSGQAECSVTYTPDAVGLGTHTITATYSGDAKHDGSTGSDDVTVTKRTTSTSVSCIPSELKAGESTTCTATVTDTDTGTKSAPTGTVSFTSSATGAFVPPTGCELVPGSGGSSRCSVTYKPTKATTHTITASYGGDPKHAASSGTATVKVNPGPPAVVTLDPLSDTNEVNTQHCVTATVKDEFGNPTPGVKVFFSVTGSNRASATKTTGADGMAEFCYTGRLFGEDIITAVADANGDGQANPGEPTGTATKTWTLPASTPLCQVDFPTAGGQITADNGDTANFGGNVHVSDSGQPSGQEQYQDKGPVDPMTVHSTSILAVVCTTTPVKQAQIFGEATIDGSGSYKFRIDVKDIAEPGAGQDTYWIVLSNGYNSGEHTLDKGNVQIH